MPVLPIVILIVLLLLGIVIFVVLRRRKSTGTRANGDFIYESWRTILTPAERSFVGPLEESLPDGVRILAKIRLGDVFYTRKDLDNSKRVKARNRINQKHLDFLLVRDSDFSPVLGVELDDKSHAESSRQLRDRFVDQLFEGCQIPLLRVPVQAAYNVAELRGKIAALAKVGGSTHGVIPERP